MLGGTRYHDLLAWLFVGPGATTDVFQYQPSNGMTTKRETESFEIVGAGVSTCAPTTPPQ